MADLINLRNARKQKTRLDKEYQAEANRIKFAKTKAKKQKSAMEKSSLERKLDGHNRGFQVNSQP